MRETETIEFCMHDSAVFGSKSTLQMNQRDLFTDYNFDSVLNDKKIFDSVIAPAPVKLLDRYM